MSGTPKDRQLAPALGRRPATDLKAHSQTAQSETGSNAGTREDEIPLPHSLKKVHGTNNLRNKITEVSKPYPASPEINDGEPRAITFAPFVTESHSVSLTNIKDVNHNIAREESNHGSGQGWASASEHKPKESKAVLSFQELDDFYYVSVNPRALAWEMLHLNDTRPETEYGRKNPFFKHFGIEVDPMLKMEYVRVHKGNAAALRNIAIKEGNQDYAKRQWENRKKEEDLEYYKEINGFFEQERIKQAKSDLAKDPANGRNTELLERSLSYCDISEYSIEDPKEGYIQDSSGKDHHPLQSTLEVENEEGRHSPPAKDVQEVISNQVGIANGHRAKEQEFSAWGHLVIGKEKGFIMREIVHRQVYFLLHPELFDRPTPSYQLQIQDFHAQRVKRLLEQRDRMILSRDASTISTETRRPFNTPHDRLFTPLTNPNKRVCLFLLRAQNETQSILDLIRLHWDRAGKIGGSHDPEFLSLKRAVGNGFGHGRLGNDQGNMINFLNTTKRHRLVIDVAIELLTADWEQDLEQDFRDLLAYAIIQYVSARPENDTQMRRAILVIWEVKVLGTESRSLDNTRRCTCEHRKRLNNLILDYYLPKEYTKFLASHCIQDHSRIKAAFKMAGCEGYEFERTMPHKLEDLAVEQLDYGDRQELVPVWLASRHRAIWALIIVVRSCDALHDVCHASDSDHVDMIMRVVWGPESIWTTNPKRGMYRSIYGAVLAAVVVQDSPDLEKKYEDLGKMLLDYDMKLLDERGTRKDVYHILKPSLPLPSRSTQKKEPIKEEDLAQGALIRRREMPLMRLNLGDLIVGKKKSQEHMEPKIVERGSDGGYLSSKAQKLLGVGVPLKMNKEKKKTQPMGLIRSGSGQRIPRTMGTQAILPINMDKGLKPPKQTGNGQYTPGRIGRTFLRILGSDIGKARQ